MKNILIACGGPSHEHEVSLNSLKSIIINIDIQKYKVSVLYIGKNLKYSISPISKLKLTANSKDSILNDLNKLKKYDLVFIAMHGEFGEDGVFQTLLELHNIKYTGCDSYSSHLCMDKYHSYLVVTNLEVKIPKTKLHSLSEIWNNYSIPCVIKPNKAGSSVGAGIIRNVTDFEKWWKRAKPDFDENAEFLVQELIDGIEVSCGCLQRIDGSFLELPPIEIVPQVSDFFDYNAKYKKGGSSEITPPKSISPDLSQKISKLSCDIHNILGCKTYSRSDFIVKGREIYYLETNTLPGMTETSLLPQEASAAGLSFLHLLDFIIENS